MPEFPLNPIDAAQARHNKVLARIAEREARLLTKLGAVQEKLNGCLERISKFDKVRAGQCRLPNSPCSLPEAHAI